MKNNMNKKVYKPIYVRVILLAIILLLMFLWSIAEKKFIKGDLVQIEATGESNDEAEGTEIWLTQVIVNDMNYSPSMLYEGKWLSDGNKVGWKAFDPVVASKNKENIVIPYGTNRKIVFESNKWRGICKVSYQDRVEELDTYSKDESGTIELSIPDHLVQNKYDGRAINVVWIVLGIAFIVVVCSFKFTAVFQGYKALNYIKRETWADVLRIICIFLVVILHATCSNYESSYNTDKWLPVMAINCFTACAVPIFFMISGNFCVKDKKWDGKNLVRSIGKLVVPLVAWSTIYILLRKYYLHENINILSSIFKIGKEDQYYHLWFVYSLLGVYILNPIINKIYYSDIRKYFLVAFGACPMIATTIAEFTNYKINISYLYIFYPIVFIFCLGRFLSENQAIVQRGAKFWLFSFGASLIILMGVTYIGSELKGGATKRFFTGFDNIIIIMMYVSIYCLFLNLKDHLSHIPERIKKILADWAEICVQIYFGHMLIYALLEDKKIAGIQLSVHSESLMINLITAVICFVLSTVLAFIIDKIQMGIRKGLLRKEEKNA